MSLMRAEINQDDLDSTLFFLISVIIMPATLSKTLRLTRPPVECSVDLSCADSTGQERVCCPRRIMTGWGRGPWYGDGGERNVVNHTKALGPYL